jgi:hypothetical protein
MSYFLIGFIGASIWFAYEIYTSPHMDDNGNITKPGKKISDLWRKR